MGTAVLAMPCIYSTSLGVYSCLSHLSTGEGGKKGVDSSEEPGNLQWNAPTGWVLRTVSCSYCFFPPTAWEETNAGEGAWGKRDSVPSNHLIAFLTSDHDFISLRRITDVRTPRRGKLGQYWSRRPKVIQTHGHVGPLSCDIIWHLRIKSTGIRMRTWLIDIMYTHTHTFIYQLPVTYMRTQTMNQSLDNSRSDAHTDSQVNNITSFPIKCVSVHVL